MISRGPEQLFKIATNLKKSFNFYCACPEQQPYFDKLVSEKIPIFKLPYRKFEIRTFLKLSKWTKMNDIAIVHSYGKWVDINTRLLKLFNRKHKFI